MRYFCSTLDIVESIVGSSDDNLDESVVEEAVAMVLAMVLDIGDADEILALQEANYYNYVQISKQYMHSTKDTCAVVRHAFNFAKKMVREYRMLYISDYCITGSWVNLTYIERSKTHGNLSKLRHAV